MTRQVPYDPGSLGQRILFCRAVMVRDPDGVIPPMTQTAFGADVARRLKRKRPVPAATVSRWEADLAVPDLATIAAIAGVGGVDVGWLTFGSATGAPTPFDTMPERDRKVARAFLEIAKQDLKAEKRVHEIRRERRANLVKLRLALAEQNRRSSKK